ncbi:MAG: FCD domain-containing protein, partial [Paracoccaceae bacterium]|nr:FCD domain-containing protein [Paracoccaceae bacterium]
YRRAKLSENCLLWNTHQRRERRSRIRLSSAIGRCGCPNQMLQSIYETVQGLLTETQRQPIPRTNPTRMRASLAEHREIIAALSRGDGAETCVFMRKHIANTAACAGIEIADSR